MNEKNHEKEKDWFSNFYHDHPLIMGGFIGGIVGFFFVSPMAMILEHLTHTGTEGLGEHLIELLTLRTIEWSVLFTTMLICIGVIFGYMQMRINKLERTLFQTEKMASVGQLAAGVAHEINNPLSNISLISEKIMMNVREGKGISEGDLEDLEKQVEHASKIISDLLDFSRIPDAEHHDLDVNDLISNTLSFVMNKTGEDIEIIENYNRDLPSLRGDQDRLIQVFTNIINNAFDAMPNGGKLEVETDTSDDGQIEIRFRDNGIGIPKENLSKIFDPFFTTKPPGKGTGLGLSICHGIVRSYGGTIEVAKENDRGTTMIIRFPR
jgi:two-component system NtrC family sensor kinase